MSSVTQPAKHHIFAKFFGTQHNIVDCNICYVGLCETQIMFLLHALSDELLKVEVEGHWQVY